MSDLSNVSGNPTIKIIWASLLFTNVVYGFIAKAVLPEPAPVEAAIKIAFAVLGLMLAVASTFVPKIVMKPKEDSQLMGVLIVEWAMIEGICVLGLVLAFMSGELMLFAPFFVVAVLLMLLAYPGDKKCQKIRERYLD